MARHARRVAEIGFDAITIEGALIAPEIVAAVGATPSSGKNSADYGCPKGTTLGDEIARYFRIGQAHWQAFARIDGPTAAQTTAFARDLLHDAFGFTDLEGPVEHNDGSRRYRIALEAKSGRVPIVCAAPVPEGDGFAKALPEFGDGEGGRARRSPVVLLQDWLNATPDSLWGLIFVGDRVRLLRDNASLTRAAWIEADLGAMFRDEMFADFTAWGLLTHASRFGAAGARPSDCTLERWREAGQKQGTTARERLREGVEAALRELGQGLVAANPDVKTRIEDGGLDLQILFDELLRVVYRLIFLAVAEDRDLLHPPNTPRKARDLYAGSYSFAHWRDRSARRTAYDAHHDAWEGMKVTFAALEAGQPLLGLPALGGLFGGGQTPVVRESQIPNRHFLMAVYRLGFLEVDSQRMRINWRDMKTEELGSVYESLLEIRPILRPNGEFALDSGVRGNARKTSGSYYTPDSLVETLLDSALDPVLDRAEAEGRAETLLDLKVIDPACGSGHFLLGAARRIADRVATLRDPDAPDRQVALRDVVGRCIHGVDRNPMAVELAKVALWIESVSPGQPLGFLDANIRCGDALLGVFDLEALEVGIPDEAYRPLTGDDKATANGLRKLNKAEREAGLLRMAIAPDALAKRFDRLHALPESTVAEVRAKAKAYQGIHGDPDWWSLRQACDAYVAAFLLPKPATETRVEKVLVPTTRHVREALNRNPPQGPLAAAIDTAANAARAFHWPIEFPDVMIGRGGFDVVLGNPPWERIKLQEQEFFAGTEIAEAINSAARTRMIDALASATLSNGEPDLAKSALFAAFQIARRVAEAMSVFARVPGDSKGRYRYTGAGDVNTYALFAEHFLNLKRERGRAGVIVPTGIATDATTAPFFGHLVSSRRLVQLLDFENRDRIFPHIDSRIKFCILTMGAGVKEASFAFFLTDPAQLEDKRRRFTLAPDQIARINPNTKTAPVFRARRDAELTAAIYNRVPVLLDENPGAVGNPWDFRVATRLWHMAEDSHWFETTSGEGRLPLYEAKMFHHFDHRFSCYATDAVYTEHKKDPTFEPTPRYWVPAHEVESRLTDSVGWTRPWLLGWRDITNATNERTVIATILPRTAVAHTSPLLFLPAGARLTSGFLSNLAALVLDFVARQKVGGTHLTVGYLNQFPVLPRSAYSEGDLAFLVPRVLELSYTSHSMASFARDLGYEGPPFSWDEERRAQLRAELDAWHALSYGLARDELRYVLDPKDVMGADYPSETFRVLQKNEIARYGEYRTRRVVLAAYDQLAVAAPDTSQVPDAAWEHRIDDPVDVRHIFAAIIKKTVGQVAPADVKLMALFTAKPHLLMQHLSAPRQAEWQRLVGSEVELVASPSIASFSRATPDAFHDAIATLRAERAIRYDAQSHTWDRGAAVYRYASLGWADGRAAYVIHAMRNMTSSTVMTAIPEEERSWIAQAA